MKKPQRKSVRTTTLAETNGDKAVRSPSPIEIREMELDDLSPVYHLGEQVFTADLPNLYRTWDESEPLFYFQSDPELCLVAELDGRIVGFILGTTIEKARSAWKYAYLAWLGIAPEFHGQGVGRRLVRNFHDRVKKQSVRMVLVDTEADNDPAIAFFKRLGFSKPEQHVFLSLNLSNKK